MSAKTNQSTTRTATVPPYRRFGYETERDDRLVSTEVHSLRPAGPQLADTDPDRDLRSSKQREERARTSFNHHEGRSTAATYFIPTDFDNGQKKRQYERLKGWNDGTRDSDRQIVEGHADKMGWAEAHGERLELPTYIIGEAQQLLRDLGDIRRLGYYNNLHAAVVAALTESYRRWGLRRRYRKARGVNYHRWQDRGDFLSLWTNCGFDESELGDAITQLQKKTDV